MLLDLGNLREDYNKGQLDQSEISDHPIQQFKNWFNKAKEAGVDEPNAMTLATCTTDGKPSARVVLLKGIEQEGFIFYTNYNSRKGVELAANPNAALVFLWQSLHQQIRIEGEVRKITSDQSTKYFQSRPKGSQIGAAASPQSEVIPDRAFLEQKVNKLSLQYKDVTILPRPAHWGGYLLRPNVIEFWQGRTSRLHDRLRYTLIENGTWKVERLAP